MDAVTDAPAFPSLAAFDVFAAGMGARIEAYLLNGTGDAVLEEIEQSDLPPADDPQAARMQSDKVREGWRVGPMRRLPSHPGAQQPDVLRRLGRLMRTFERQESRRRAAGPPAGASLRYVESIWYIRPLSLHTKSDWRSTSWAWMPYLVGHYAESYRDPFPFSMTALADAFTADGLSREAFLGFCFAWPLDGGYSNDYARALHKSIAAAPGYAAFVESTPGPILERLTGKSLAIRTEALNMAMDAGLTDPAVATAIGAFLRDSGKTARAEGAKAALRHPDGFDIAIGALAAGPAAARAEAAALAMQIDPARARPFLEEQAALAKQKSAALYESLMELLGTQTEAEGTDAAEAIAIPTYAPLPPAPPIAAIVAPRLLAVMERRLPSSRHRDADGTERVTFANASFDRMAQAMAADIDGGASGEPFWNHWEVGSVVREAQLADCPQVQLIHLLRVAVLTRRHETSFKEVSAACPWFASEEELTASKSPVNWPLSARFFLKPRLLTLPGFDLRQWADAMEACGLSRDLILEQVLAGTCPPPRPDRDDDAIWPYFAERIDRLLAVLAIKPVDTAQKTAEAAALAILQALPQLSPRFLASVTERAFDRPAVAAAPWSALLRRIPGSVEAVRDLLRSPKPERRGRAALWLVEAGCTQALPEVMDAARKEKSATLRGTLLSAVVDLGGDVSSFIDRATLDREADAVLARGIPKDWNWVPFDRLSLNWADGTPVRPQTLQAWVLQHLQAKSALAPGAMRAVLAGMDRSSGQALAAMLVQWWMAGWVTLVTDAFFRAELEASLDKHRPGWRRYVTPQEMVEAIAQSKADNAGPSALHRGLLGFAAPLAGPETVALLQPLLAKAKADKRHQLMAALDFLSQIDAPSAVQAIVAVGHRFGSGTVRERAEAIVAAIAQRKGWSRDELEDRSVPDLGLDAHGRAVLDYGARQFTVQLTEAMGLKLFAGDKPVKSLPSPGVQDDAALAKAAKATLTAMKRELKAVLALQPMRLHAAMLTGRSWRFGDWQALVQQHPVLGRLAQRLVWLAEDGSTSFRPHADGAVLDATDEPAVLAAEARVIVAHATRMPEEAIAAWTQSFADYAVQPLFPQWGRTPLPALEPGQMELGGFLDWQLDAFTLRNAATRRGWVRGPVGEGGGGGFDSYRRAFPELKLELRLVFSGSYVPEENIPVALVSVSAFSRGRAVPLAEVPDVLLQEAYADMADIAASGPGYLEGWSAQTDL